MEPTVEQCLEDLRGMFPEAVRVYVSEDADYFDGALRKEAFILIMHTTFRAATLGEAMAQVHKWHNEQ